MVFGLFGTKKQETITILSPMTGEVKEISAVPDPVFAEKMMGDGFCVEPADGKVLAPVDGELVNLFPTKHAVGIRTPEGLEILVHVGIETVGLDGEGFTAHVEQGATVKAGQLLLEVDLAQIRDKVPSVITPVVFTTLGEKPWNLVKKGHVQAGEAVAEISR